MKKGGTLADVVLLSRGAILAATLARIGNRWRIVVDSGAMESKEISHHQVRLFNYLSNQTDWCTAAAASEGSQIASRTARMHLLKFVKAGIVDQMTLFPGHRYRLSPLAEKRNKTLIQRLKAAVEVFKE